MGTQLYEYLCDSDVHCACAFIIYAILFIALWCGNQSMVAGCGSDLCLCALHCAYGSHQQRSIDVDIDERVVVVVAPITYSDIGNSNSIYCILHLLHIFYYNLINWRSWCIGTL